MKKILYILAIFVTSFTKAQTILPQETSILCPNQEYTFTVSLPGNYISLNSIGGPTVT